MSVNSTINKITFQIVNIAYIQLIAPSPFSTLAWCLQVYIYLIRMVVTRIWVGMLNNVCMETLSDHRDTQH